MKRNKPSRRWRPLGWALLLLPVAVVLTLYVPRVQDAATQWVATWLTRRLGSEVKVGKARLRFPLQVEVEGVQLGTQLSIERVGANIRLSPLMQRTVRANYVVLKGLALRPDTAEHALRTNFRTDLLRLDGIAYDLRLRIASIDRILVTGTELDLLQNSRKSRESNPISRLPIALHIKEMQLLNTEASYANAPGALQGKVAHMALQELGVDTSLHLSLHSAQIEEGVLSLRQGGAEPLRLTQLTAQIDSLRYAPTHLEARLTRLSFNEPHGIDLQRGEATLHWNGGILGLPHIALHTKYSSLSGQLNTLNINNFAIDGKANLSIGYADALSLAQGIEGLPKEFARHYPTEALSASVALHGTSEQLQLSHCQLSLPSVFDINMSGTATHITDPKQRKTQCHIKAKTHEADLLGAITDTLTKGRISIPQEMALTGYVSYAPDTLHAQCAITLSEGMATLEAGYRPTSKSYEIQLQTDSLNMQLIMPDGEFGRMSMQVYAKGNGTDWREEKTYAQAALQLHTLQWKGLTLTNASAKASLADRQLRAHTLYGDSLMQWRMMTTIKYAPDSVKVRFNAQVDKLDMKALHLANTDIHPTLRCHATLAIDSGTTYTLHAQFKDIVLNTATQHIQPRPLELLAFVTSDTALVNIHSGDLSLTSSAHIKGLPWEQGKSFKHLMNNYLSSLQATLTAGDDNPVSNYLALTGIRCRTLKATFTKHDTFLKGALAARDIVVKGFAMDSIGITARHPQGQLLALDNLSGTLHLANATYSLPAYSLQLHTEGTLTIPFERGTLKLASLPLYTSHGQPLLLDGNVSLAGTAPTLQLRLTARNVNLLQATPSRGTILFGKALATGSVTLEGPLSALSLTGSIHLQPGTSIHYIYRDAILTASNQLDRVVTFVSFDADSTTILKTGMPTSNLTMNISVNIDPTAQLEVSLGASKQNSLNIQGGGMINLQYVPASGIRLAGKYTIEQGTLSMNVPLLHVSTMAIRTGSTITWEGNPLTPLLNIVAEDRLRASVTLDGSPQSVLFVAGISLTDTMEKLNVQFTLATPENAAMQNMLATLSPEERGKLAVALLTTGLYLGEGGTGNLMNTALMGLLQAQLDDISRDAFRTVDVSVGIEPLPDGVSGVSTRTDYSFSIAKRLWDNRIRIIIGGSVTTNNERIESDAIIDNISIEWRISPIGNQYLRFFYEKNFESILEGEVRETGVGYAYRRNF